jgi:vancomycin aglycone glucosyltransferase
MRVLISSIGSRGDVQPIIALGLEFLRRGHDARLCVAPNFKEWVESLGLTCLPIGPDLKQMTGGTAPRNPPPKPSAEQLRQLAAYTLRAQFPVITAAAQGCDLIIAGGALQLATRSIAQSLKIPYVFAAYCPAVLPSTSHPPPRLDTHYSQSLPAEANQSLWLEEDQRWNALFREALNDERAKLGLEPVESVQRHIFTDRPWLAADPSIAPAGSAGEMQITQTGAWLLRDQRSLPDHVENFLAGGEPPIYFGFGSMRTNAGSSRILIEAARALGLRSIVSQGWGNLSPIDDASDCLSVDDLPHESLFPRVAAVVHHGGAGTTTAAARAGKGQIIVPHLYDQYYWAHRARSLRIGVEGPTRDTLTASAIAAALRQGLNPDVTTHAQALAGRLELQGAQIATDRLIREFA